MRGGEFRREFIANYVPTKRVLAGRELERRRITESCGEDGAGAAHGQSALAD
jgi:hypothetical protein